MPLLEECNGPISASLFSFKVSQRDLKSFPTTLSTSSGSASLVPSKGLFARVSRVARVFVHEILGQDTFSRVPSLIAKVQHELRQGEQLDVRQARLPCHLSHSQHATAFGHLYAALAFAVLEADGTGKSCLLEI